MFRSGIPSASILLAMLACGVGSGCKKTESPTASAAPPAQIQGSIQGAFKDAKPEVQAVGKEIESSLQNNDYGKAFVQLNELSRDSRLTPDQQKVVVQSQASMNKELQKKAQQGDKESADLLRAYLIGK